MMLHYADPHCAGAFLVVCDPTCASRTYMALGTARLHPALPGRPIDDPHHCLFCCWCGTRLTIGDGCLWHGATCPERDWRHTIQLQRLASWAAQSVGRYLSDDEWDLLDAGLGADHLIWGTTNASRILGACGFDPPPGRAPRT